MSCLPRGGVWAGSSRGEGLEKGRDCFDSNEMWQPLQHGGVAKGPGIGPRPARGSRSPSQASRSQTRPQKERDAPRTGRAYPWGVSRSWEGWAAGELCFQPWSLDHRLTSLQSAPPPPPPTHNMFSWMRSAKHLLLRLWLRSCFLRAPSKGPAKRKGRCLSSLTKETGCEQKYSLQFMHTTKN